MSNPLKLLSRSFHNALLQSQRRSRRQKLRTSVQRDLQRLRVERLEERALLAIDLVSTVDPSLVVATGNDNSAYPKLSADGTKVVFFSLASDLVGGDFNDSWDVFVKDLSTGIITCASTSSTGIQGNSHSFDPVLSADGTKVIFYSHSSNLVPGDTNNRADVFIKYLLTGAITRVSTDSNGIQGNGESQLPTVSADGTKVAFQSSATNLVSGDSNNTIDIFVKDVISGVTTRVSTDSTGVQGNQNSTLSMLSGDGTTIAFQSLASNLVTGDTNGVSDVFIKDLLTGIVTRVSTDSVGAQGNNNSLRPNLSENGQKVAFLSSASNLVSGDTNSEQDVFLKDLVTGVTTRVNTASNGAQANGTSVDTAISTDGTKVAFSSYASNLVTGDTNGQEDVFVKDLVTGLIALVSTDSNGNLSSGASFAPALSADGLKIAFTSDATNLISRDLNSKPDVVVKDLPTGAVQLASSSIPQLGGNGASDQPVLSADGTKIAFQSNASNLVSGDTNNTTDVFLKDLVTGVTTRASNDSAGIQGIGPSDSPSMNSDGTLIAFRSIASNLVSGDTNNIVDIFLKNLVTGVTTRISTDSAGAQGNSFSHAPSLSADGRRAAFFSYSTNLVFGDSNNQPDVFVKDLITGVTTRVSTDSVGAQGNGSSLEPSLNADGTKIAFASSASNLVPGDSNGRVDIFVKDLVTGSITQVSTDSAGSLGNGDSNEPYLSADGTMVAFTSAADNLVNGDTNGSIDVFVKNLVTGLIARVSTDTNGIQGNGGSATPSLNAEGRKVVFRSAASNLVSGGTNAVSQIYLKDLVTGVTTRLSTDSSGVQGNGGSNQPAVSLNGGKVAFASNSTNLHQNDRTSILDLYLVTLGNAPTDVSLTNTQIAENAGSNAVIGTLTGVDPDVGDSLTFSLPAGFGSNALFNISGTSLRANNSFDFEGINSFVITVRATDTGGLFFDKQFTIHVTNVNDAPTDLSLSQATIAENNLANAVVGLFNSTDQDAGDTFTYSLVTGAGSTDNGAFTISGNQLRANTSFDYEAKNTYSIRVRTNDTLGESFEKSFTIIVTDVDDTPPLVSSASFLASGTVLASSTSLTVSFSEPVFGTNLGGSYELRRAGADGLLGNSDDVIIPIASATYASSTKTATLSFAGLAEDVYRLTVKDTITDQVGNALDGDNNGTAGGNWRRDFVVGLPNDASTKPLLPNGRHGQATGRFGYAVAADTTYRVVGAPFADSPINTDVGYAYVYDTASGELKTTLRNPTPANNDLFGYSVAVSGNIVAVGAYLDDTTAVDSGSVYLFNVTNGALLATIANPTPAANDLFGLHVAISGNSVVVSAVQDDTTAGDSGSVYVFNTATGALLTTIANPTPAAGDNFGSSVGVSGNTIVVGASGDDNGGGDSGSAYLFNATNGSLIATLANPTPAANDVFGSSAAISGNVVVVSAFQDDTGANDSGSAYLFNATTGALVATLVNPSPGAGDDFGYSVDVSGNTVVVGAYSDDSGGEDSGKAYLFNASSGALTATLAKPTPVSFDELGLSVAISGSSVLVGAPYDDALENASGSVFVFDSASGTLKSSVSNPIPGDNGQAGSSFGYSVAVDGNYRVVGAPFGDFGSTADVGYAYVYQADTGELIARLNNPTPSATDYFGYSVAISGNLVVVGAFQDDSGAIDSGTVYLFSAISGELLRTIANPTPAVSDYFGYRVAISGNNVVVGAFQDDSTGTDSGSAYVFNATSGALVATLANPTPAAGDNFGNAVAVSGNVVVVGAYFDNTGATDSGTAYVFSATDGSLISTLSNPFPGTGDGFGKSVAISSDTVVIGSTDDDTAGANSGSAYVFSASTGTLLRTLANPTPAEADDFGVSVAVYGNTIVVGSNLDDTTASDGGSAYVFNSTTGTLIATLANPSPASTDLFGYSVAISPTSILVGAYLDDESGINSGDVYVFDATTGVLQEELSNPITPAGDSFGNSVAASGDFVVVGAPFDNSGATDSGLAYVFDATTGELVASLSNPTPAANDWFGFAVAVSGNTVVVGARLDDTGASDSGVAYVFDATTGALLATLANPTPAAGDNFGYSVSVSGNLAVVGAIGDDAGATDSGTAYVFNATSGALIATLSNPFPAAGNLFGSSIAISGTAVVVGAPFADAVVSSGGMAYVFNAATGSPISTLSNPTPSGGDFFGSSVAISGNLVVVGAREDDAVATDSGAAYIFDSSTGALLSTLTSPSQAANDLFGRSVSISNSIVAVGALNGAGGAVNSGWVYMFNANSSDLRSTIANPTPATNDQFAGVAASGNTIVVGASLDDTANLDAGAAYIFTAETNRSFIGPNDHSFFVAGSSRGAGQLVQGSDNAFDGLNRLQIGGADFVPGVSSVSRLDDGDRTILTPVVTLSNLEVSREVTVPSTGAQDFARTLDVFTNPTGSAITVPVRLVGNLGFDAATTVFATSDGDLLVEPTDLWFGTDDGDGVGAPAVIHLLHAGFFGIQPTALAVTDDNVDWTFSLTVNAGQTKRLATYTILGNTRADAIASVNALVGSNGFLVEAATFLTASELASIANYQFNQAPTDIQLSSSSIAENNGVNALVAMLVTVDPNLNVGDTHTYALVGGPGSTDNGSFTIVGNELRANSSFDFEVKNNYLIRIRSTDATGAAYEESFTINVTDVDDTPPVVTGASFLNSGTLSSGATSLQVSFSELVTFSLGSQQNPARSAWEIKQINPSASDGIYWIDPDGSGSIAPFQVYCDMTTDGGGWMLAVNSLLGSEPASNDIVSNTGTVGLTTAQTRNLDSYFAGTATAEVRHDIDGSNVGLGRFHGKYTADSYQTPFSGMASLLTGHTNSALLQGSFNSPFTSNPGGASWFYSGNQSTTAPASPSFGSTGPFYFQSNQILNSYRIWIRSTVTGSGGANGAELPSNYELRRAGIDGLLGNSDDVIVPITAVTYASGTNTATLSFSGLAEDVYRLTVKDTILDQAGNTLDGDGNGTAGVNWRKDFVVGALTTSLTSPNGFAFDPEFGGVGAGQLVQGTNNSFDGMGRLEVGGTNFSSQPTQRGAWGIAQLTPSVSQSIPTGVWQTLSFDSVASSSGSSVISATPEGATLSLSVSKLVRVSGEISLQSGTGTWNYAEIDFRILVDGVRQSGNHIADHADFQTGNGFLRTYSIEQYATLGPGTHTVTIECFNHSNSLSMMNYSGLAILELEGPGATSTTGITQLAPSVHQAISTGVWKTLSFDSVASSSGSSVISATPAGATLSLSVSKLIRVSGEIILQSGTGTWNYAPIDFRILVDGVRQSGNHIGDHADFQTGNGFLRTYSIEQYATLGPGTHTVTVECLNYSNSLSMMNYSGLAILELEGPEATSTTGIAQLAPSVHQSIPTGAWQTLSFDSVASSFGSSVTSATPAGATLILSASKLVRVSGEIILESGTGTWNYAEIDFRILVDGVRQSGNHIVDHADFQTGNGFLRTYSIEQYATLGPGTHTVAVECFNHSNSLSMMNYSGLAILELEEKITPVFNDAGRSVIVNSNAIAGVNVSREVAVPSNGTQSFARTVDVFTNPTSSAISVPVRLVGNLGSDAATTVFATSDGDLLVEPTDWWFATDDDNATGGTPAIVHLLHGPFGLQPSSVDVIEDNIQWSYNLTVGPGETKRLASFTVLGTTRQQAIDAANALVTYNGFGGQASAFLTNDELSSLANFQFNQAPTDISLSISMIPENAGSNAVVGTLGFSDPNFGDTGIFSLPTGLADNSLFNIGPDGNSLRANDSFDFELKNSYNVIVRVADAGGLTFDKPLTIQINNVNETPVDILISNPFVVENIAMGSPVGSFSTNDPDSANTFLYTLVPGAGSGDNGAFSIDASGILHTNTTSINFEAKPNYSIRVRSTDQGGLWVEKQFTIQVVDLLEISQPIQIGDGTVQRSVVKQLVISFDQSVIVDPGAFVVEQRIKTASNTLQLNNVTTNVALTPLPGGRTKAILTFSGIYTLAGTNALVDGNYQLTIDGSKIRNSTTGSLLDADGDGFAGGTQVLGTQAADNFFALMGDANGNGEVDAQDLLSINNAFRSRIGQANYNAAFDINGNNQIDAQDLLSVRNNFRKKRNFF